MTRDELKAIAASIRELPDRVESRALRPDPACRLAGALIEQLVTAGLLDRHPVAKAAALAGLARNSHYAVFVDVVSHMFPDLDQSVWFPEITLGCPALADWLDDVASSLEQCSSEPASGGNRQIETPSTSDEQYNLLTIASAVGASKDTIKRALKAHLGKDAVSKRGSPITATAAEYRAALHSRPKLLAKFNDWQRSKTDA